MKTLAYAFALSILSLVGCGDSGTSAVTLASDAGVDTGVTAAADTGAAAAVDTGVTAAVDTGAAPAETYPAGPYGSSVGRLFRPFSLTACNREGDDAQWRFDGPDFFTNQLTVISISAAWCVPCQRESAQMEEQLVRRYVGRGVRVVQLLVQNVDRSAINAATCRGWATRYGLSFPELMDPMFITQPFVPNTAFPGNIIVDRCGRIRWREYGSETGLTSMRTAIDEVLADPRYPNCPTE